MTERNLFKAVAMALWEQGGDGEEIARDMAVALQDVIQEGKGKDFLPHDVIREFARLIKPV